MVFIGLCKQKVKILFCSSQIKKAWEVTQSTRTNLNQMGLAYDANEVLNVTDTKDKISENIITRSVNTPETKLQNEDVDMIPVKQHVVQELEAEAKTPRRRMFRLPNNQVHFLTYLMDKYGEDYKVMFFLQQFISY